MLHHIAAQVVTDLVGIPTSMVEQPLHPVWGVLTGMLGQLPTVLTFHACQQTAQERSCPTADLDPAKPLRHAMHVDVSVAREQAEHRLAAAVAAGGRIVEDSHAPAAWILADRAGNRVCIAAWPDGAPE